MEDHKFDLINVDFVAVQRYLFSSSTSRCTVVDDSSAAGFPFDISDNTIFAFLMACCCKVTNLLYITAPKPSFLEYGIPISLDNITA